MNIEEARRAGIRREEDQLWGRIKQQAERSYGETVRQQQRTNQQRKEAYANELQDAQYEYAAAKSEENRVHEEERRLREAEERQRLDTQRRVSMKKEQERRFRDKKKRADDENAILEQELRREGELKRRRDQERRQREKISIRDHLSRSQGYGGSGKSKTPGPGGFYGTGSDGKEVSVSPNRRSQSSLARGRPICTEDEVFEKQQEDRRRERQLREVRHLENLLSRRRKEEAQRQHRLQLEAHIEEEAARKAAQLAEKEIEEKQAHFEHLERNREAQLEGKRKLRDLSGEGDPHHLPDLLHKNNNHNRSPAHQSSSSSSGLPDASSMQRMRLEAQAKNENDVLHRARLERKIQEEEKHAILLEKARVKQMKRQVKEQQKRDAHSKMVTTKARINLEHVRAIRKAEIENLDRKLYLEMGAAKRANYSEARDMAEFAVALKENEQQRTEFAKWKAAQRSLEIQKKAVQSRLEMAEMREQLAKRAGERREIDTALADGLSKNRLHTLEQVRLKALKDKEREAVLQAQQRKSRMEANATLEAERAKKLEERTYHQSVRKRDTQVNREKRKAMKEAEMERNAAFYSTAVAKKAEVPKVKKMTDGERVVLPPHPEMRGLEQDTEAFLRSLTRDLEEVDGRISKLPKRI